MTTAVILLLNFNALFFLIVFLSLRHSLISLDSPVFFHSLLFTLGQAIASAVCSILLGLFIAPGYARLGKIRRLFRWIFLLPNIMSPILAVLCLLLTFDHFPFGFWGIILGHLFLNGGLSAVWLGERWVEIEERWGPVNRVLGGKVFNFYWRGLLPLMKNQILNTFAVVFSLCLTSFAVPLVLGGGPQSSTLEVLIYERIHADADIASAIALGLIQCALQFAVYFTILKPILLKTESSRFSWQEARFSIWSLPVFVMVFFCLAPLVSLSRLAFGQGALMGLLAYPEFVEAARTSLFVGLAIGVMSFILLCWLGGWGWTRALLTAPALSGVAVGLAGLLIFKTWRQHSTAVLIAALVWGHMSVVFLPVFRLCAPGLQQLRLHFDKALVQLGTPKGLAFSRIYFPLGIKTYLAGAVLAGCWSMGEFSVSSMVSPGPSTLPVFVQSLLSSYRLENAAAASVVLLLLSVISMTLLEVLVYGVG